MLKSSFAALAAVVSFSAFAAPPDAKVAGPEAVADWFTAGQNFLSTQSKIKNRTGTAKNVILFVGDGMGISTVTAARIRKGEVNGIPGPERSNLSWETFPNAAFSRTYQWDQQTPDSAPTSTAMHTGYKSRDGMLSVSHSITRATCDKATTDKFALKTIVEYAAEEGKSVGLVSTARITHATPAAAYAHSSVRDWESDSDQANTSLQGGSNCTSLTQFTQRVPDIAYQLVNPANAAVKAQLKVALGGGRTKFFGKSRADDENTSSKGERTDELNLTEQWVSSRTNAKYVFNNDGFNAATAANTDYLLGLFERSHMQYEADRNTAGAGEPSLAEMTKKAIEILAKNKKGYFLQVEGGRIDHAHHAGNASRALTDTLAFSDAIAQAMTQVDLDNTLIIVTADHSHTFTMGGYGRRGNPILGLVQEVPTVDGTAPVNAADTYGKPYTTLGYYNGSGYRGDATGSTRPTLTYDGTTTPTAAATSVTQTGATGFMQEVAVPLTSETHAGEDVGIWAIGPYSHYVRGAMEQHYIFHVMAKAFGFKKFVAAQ
ncbi:MAG: alkaline phosphatase [Betaproteobacteria bacterium]|nr:alkaline phosphatase [Betaproteobacteria bacterium]